jgi:hypothetical protein
MVYIMESQVSYARGNVLNLECHVEFEALCLLMISTHAVVRFRLQSFTSSVTVMAFDILRHATAEVR